VVEVGLEFVPAWVVGAPIPVLVNFWDRELIDWDRAVDTSSGINILATRSAIIYEEKSMSTYPAPGTTKALPSIIQDRVEALLPAFVQRIGATKSGSNNEDVYVEIVGVRTILTPPLTILPEVGLEDTLGLRIVNAAHCGL
jgi:hypothetical protein